MSTNTRWMARRTASRRMQAALVLTGGAIALAAMPAAAQAGTTARIQGSSSAAAAAISEVPTPGVEALDIAAGPDGSVWYTAVGPNSLAEVGEIPAGGAPVYFSDGIFQAGQDGEDGDLGPIALGPDDNLWFTQSAEPSSAGAGVVYRISSGVGNSGDGPAGAVKYERADGILPNVGGITGGPGGRVYFTETSAAIDPPAGAPEEVGSMGVHGGVTGGIPGAPSLPGAVTEDREGNLWFLEPGSEEIARMTPAGVLTQVPVDVAGLRDITVGPDGNLWFTSASAIGRISPSGTGLQLFPVPVVPDQITAGPDGNLWFTTSDTVTTGGRESGQLGMITTAGLPTMITQGITGLGTFGIAATSTQVWFTEGASDRFGVVSF
jgi:virginiamycin B lyase